MKQTHLNLSRLILGLFLVLDVFIYFNIDLIFFEDIVVYVSVASVLFLAWFIYNNSNNTFLVFFFTLLTIFMLGRPIAYVFFGGDLLSIRSVINRSFSTELLCQALLLVKVGLTILYIGLSKVNVFSVKQEFKSNLSFYSLGRSIFLISYPFAIYGVIVDLVYFLQHGLLSFYQGQGRSGVYSGIGQVSRNTLEFGYYFILASIPSRKKFIKYSILFAVLVLISSLKGVRGFFVLPVLFMLWYYTYFYGSKILSYKYVLPIVFIFIFTQVIEGFRSKENVSLGLGDMISSQGFTFSVITLYLDKKTQLEEKGYGNFIFSPIVFPYHFLKYGSDVMGQKRSTVRIRNELNHTLTYELNNKYYLSGRGLGSSYIIELFEYGFFAVILGSILLVGFMRWFFKNLYKPIFLFLSFEILTHLLIIGRSNFFYNTWLLGKLLLVFFIGKIIINYYRKD